MAPWLRARNTAKAEIIYRLHNRPCENRIWLSNRSGPYTLGTLLTAASELGTYVINILLPLLSEELELVEVRVTDWNVPNGMEVRVPLTSYFGGIPGAACPANVAASVYLRVDVRGGARRGGHIVLPGVPRSVVVENELDYSWRQQVIAALYSLRFYPFSNMVLWHYLYTTYFGVPVGAYIGTQHIDPMFTTPYVAPRRRRLRNVVYP